MRANQFLPVFFFADTRTRFNVIPRVLERWVLIMVALYGTYSLGIKGEDWKMAGIVFGLGLILLLADAGFSYYILNSRQKLRNRIYKQFYIQFGLPSLGGYDKEKANARFMRKVLRTKFSGVETIDSIVFNGEASKVSFRDAKNFKQFLDGLAREGQFEFVVSFDEIHTGVVRAHRLPKGSSELLEMKDQLTILGFLESEFGVYVTTTVPTVTLSEWDDNVPHFTTVEITNLTERISPEYRTQKFLALMERTFPVKDHTWRLEVLPGVIKLDSLAGDSLRIQREKEIFFIENVISKIEKSMKRGTYFGGRVEAFELDGAGPNLISIFFRNPGGLFEDANYKEFVYKLNQVLAKKYGGTWYITSQLEETKIITCEKSL